MRWTAALLAAGVIAIAAAIITIVTDKGEFVLETDDRDIALQLDKAGVKISDRSAKREYLLKVGKNQIRSGEYEINVSELPDGVNEARPSSWAGEKIVVTARAVRPARPGDTGAAQILRPEDKPLTRDGVTADQGGWRIEAKERRTVRLFEFPNPGHRRLSSDLPGQAEDGEAARESLPGDVVPLAGDGRVLLERAG